MTLPAVGIGLHREGRMATLTLSRPPLNILDLATLQQLERGLGALTRDPGLDLLVVRGAGERAFSAGVAVHDHVGDRIGPALSAFHGAVRQLRDLDAITLACVRGHCLGGGLELALACDLVVASEDASFGLPEIRIGVPSVIEAALLPGMVGPARAAEILLLGAPVTAAQALEWGLVNRVVPPSELEAVTQGLVESILTFAPTAVRLQKELIVRWRNTDLRTAIESGINAFAQCYATAEPREAMLAYLEKRKPRFA